MNGLTTATVDRVKDRHNLIDCEQIEMEAIQVKIEGGKAPDKKAVSVLRFLLVFMLPVTVCNTTTI